MIKSSNLMISPYLLARPECTHHLFFPCSQWLVSAPSANPNKKPFFHHRGLRPCHTNLTNLPFVGPLVIFMSLLEACWHDLDLNITRWEVLSQRCSSRFSGTLYSSFSSTTFVASWLAKSEPSPTLLNTWASFTKYALNCKTDVLWHSLSLTQCFKRK